MNNYIKNSIFLVLLVLSLALTLFTSAHSATITIVNGDGPGEGLNDPAPFAGAPGNNASTLGQARENSFLYAAALLGAEIESNVVIQVRARFDSQFCSSNSATLGSAGALSVHRDFTNAPIPGTFYPQALANSYAGTDLNANPDIGATFNSNLNGNSNCLGGIQWYYGTDANPPNGTIDFVSTAIHEIIHGLGFSSQITQSGAFLNAPYPAVYDRFLIDDNLTPLDTANNSTRQAAILSGNGLLWEGLSVREIVSQKTAGTRDISGNEYIQMFAPSPYQGGSSTSHYDTAVFPNEIMEPSLVVDEHDLTFSLALLEDIGWILSNNPPADPEGTNAGECSDGLDNDIDGHTDCADSGCSADPSCLPPVGEGPYVEQDGQVVIEAEFFDENNAGNTDDWQLMTNLDGFSGAGYMESLPNNGTNNNSNYAANSPELNYLVNFTNPGTYFVWVRGCGSSGANDSLHAGVNGQENTTANRMQLASNCSNFVWTRARMSSAPDATINVSTGIEEINIWMREDGSRIDKILLTQDSGFIPTGSGPVQSTRDDNPPPQQFNLNVSSNGGSGTGTITSNPTGINCGSDCSESYNENTDVTLIPNADTGSSFDSWTGDSDCLDGVVTMNSAKSCTAVFNLLPPETYTLNIVTNSGTGNGDVTSNPGGIDCGVDCEGTYNEDEIVTLTADPSPGSAFNNWDGDCAGSNVITNVTMTTNKTCSAVFDLDEPGGSNAFVESGGQVVMEAENYDNIISRSAKNWELRTNQGGFSGTGYMESRPNTELNINSGYSTTSPELNYLVNFTNPGTYFVWVRGCGTSGKNDSVHAGVNGQENTTANRIQLINNCTNFVWTKARMSGGSDARVTVGTGEHEINLWMREDGSRVDRILLTTSNATPAGAGPPESPREDDPPPDPEGTNPGECTDGVDNDNDGPVDCADSGCFSDPACTGGTGPFIESGGQVVMEAENYDNIIGRSSKDWEVRTNQGGFSGDAYMHSLPNTELNINSGYSTTSPELNYLVNFTNPGTYFVWVRGCGTSGKNDSVHAGVNGQENTTANRIQLINNCSNFVWTKARMSGGSDARVTVGTGEHEINLWMREDGSRVDKIVLTQSSGFTPNGSGPAESPRE